MTIDGTKPAMGLCTNFKNGDKHEHELAYTAGYLAVGKPRNDRVG